MTIITRETYQNLPNRPPSKPLALTAKTADGSDFAIDGMINMDFELVDTQNKVHLVRNHRFLVCPDITSNILGRDVEKLFQVVAKNNNDRVWCLTTPTGEKIGVRMVEEKLTPATASVKIAKTTMIPEVLRCLCLRE